MPINRPNTLLVSENSLREFSYIDKNVKGADLTLSIVFVQDNIVESLLGTNLFQKLLYLVNSGEIYQDGNECYKELLDGYLFNLIAYSVIADLQIPLTFQTRNKGNVRSEDEKLSVSTASDTKYIENYYKEKANVYRIRLFDYLKCNCDCFPELKDCTMYGDKKPKSNDPVSSGLLLKVNRKRRIKP